MQARRKKIKPDYSSKKYANPFFQNRKPSKPRRNKSSAGKPILAIAIILIITAVIVWAFLFSKLFTIKNVQINSPEKIPRAEVENSFWQQTNSHRFLLGSQKNIFLFDEKSFINGLNSKYVLGQATIKKNLPNKMIIDLKDKIFTSIWVETGKYYYVSDDGDLEEVDPLQIKNNSLPLIENTGNPMIQNNKLMNQSDNIKFITNLYLKLKSNQCNLQIDKFTITDNEDSIVKAVIKGPTLIFSNRSNLDLQVSKLSAIIKEKLKDDFLKKSYIDLRFGDKVYFQ